jgi:hypothetical protein
MAKALGWEPQSHGKPWHQFGPDSGMMFDTFCVCFWEFDGFVGSLVLHFFGKYWYGKISSRPHRDLTAT